MEYSSRSREFRGEATHAWSQKQSQKMLSHVSIQGPVRLFSLFTTRSVWGEPQRSITLRPNLVHGTAKHHSFSNENDRRSERGRYDQMFLEKEMEAPKHVVPSNELVVIDGESVHL